MRTVLYSASIVLLFAMAAVIGPWAAHAWAQGAEVTAAELPPPPAFEAPTTAAPMEGSVVAMANEPSAMEAAAGPAEEAAEVAGEVAVELSDPQNEPLPVQNGIITHLPLNNAPIRLVLRQLAVMSEKNIIASKAVQGNVTCDLYNVTFREALDAILRVNGLDYIEQGNFIYVYTAKEMEDIRKAQRRMGVRYFQLYYVSAGDAQKLIAPCLSSDGSVSTSPASARGIPTSPYETGANDYAVDDVLIVRDYDENLDAVARLLKEIDKRPQQVLIEATILRVRLEEDNALGVDFNTLSGVNFANLSATTNGITNLNTGTVPVNTLNGDASTFRTDFNTAIDPGGFTFGYIGSDVAVFVRALEGVTDTTILANPKLLVVNKQRGEVLVGSRDGYLTTTLTETAATQTVEFLETGTRLVVRPFIGDNGHIRLEIHPEDSSGSVSDGLPSKQTTECTSNVLVRDGRTIIIGGLFREITTASRAQIPVLGNIPYAGAAFRRVVESTTREEVVILITPRIVKQPADEIIGEQLRVDAERIRIGARQGLMCFGRSRLAAAHMEWARQHVAMGEQGKALWDVNMALSLTPRLPEAIDLKERLTNEAIWAHEPRVSTVEWVLQRTIAQELGLDYRILSIPARPYENELLPASAREAMGIGPYPVGKPLVELPAQGQPVEKVKPLVEPVDSPTEEMIEPEAVVPALEAVEPEIVVEALVQPSMEAVDVSAESVESEAVPAEQAEAVSSASEYLP